MDLYIGTAVVGCSGACEHLGPKRDDDDDDDDTEPGNVSCGIGVEWRQPSHYSIADGIPCAEIPGMFIFILSAVARMIREFPA